MRQPCALCPWRPENHGRKTPWGFYTRKNLQRLWSGIRRGNPQSCHPTDPSHPDHIAAGAKPGLMAEECAGAVVLVMHELRLLQGDAAITGPAEVERYLRKHRDGLTKAGILYWAVKRVAFANVPFVGAPKLPEVDEDFPVARL